MNKIPLIIGLGKTGVSLAKYLAKSAETLYILESSPNNKYLKELKDLDIKYILNPEISEKTFKLISSLHPSPGVSIEHEAFQYAKNLNIPIQTDINMYLTNSQSYNILVTGTNGKTTTVSMLEHLLRGFFKDKSILAIGNIGKPVLDFLDNKLDIAIIEISSFQIEASSRLNSDIGILLNISQDHIDRHKDYSTYKSLKKRVLKDSNSRITIDAHKVDRKSFIDYKKSFKDEDFLKNPIFEKWPIHDINNLKAALTALSIVQYENNKVPALSRHGHSKPVLDEAFRIISSFKRQPHRFELIENNSGVLYINDSKATNIDATLKAIESSRNLNKEGKIFLICGGDLKGQKLDHNVYLNSRTSKFKEIETCFIYGKDKEILKEKLSNITSCFCCDDLDSAYSLAKKESKKGDLILLSPACSSTDMFADYRERGNRFKGLIKS